MSADGRFVVFTSSADNLVAGDTNGQSDVFRKDLATGEITRVSVAVNGVESSQPANQGAISHDGRYVLVESTAALVAGDSNAVNDIFNIDTLLQHHATAAAEGRFVNLMLNVGSASSLRVSWGDGAVDVAAPDAGAATFRHIYAVGGQKSATITVSGGSETWSVPYVVDLASGQMTRDSARMDERAGGASADTLVGDGFSNSLKGLAGRDTLKSGGGHDKLYGGFGNDVLTGGAGRDVFVFDAKIGTAKTNKTLNRDKITDFNVKDDTIWLDNAVFRKLGKGTELKPLKLSKAFFSLGDKARDANDYLIYNKKTGVLSYDSDGSGPKAAIEIAVLPKNLKLTYADFFVI